MGIIDWNGLLNKVSSSWDEAKKQLVMQSMPAMLRTWDEGQSRTSLPISQRVYLRTMLDRNMAPITESDLTDQEREALYNIVSGHHTQQSNEEYDKGNRRSGEDNKGAVGYMDYPSIEMRRHKAGLMGLFPSPGANEPDFLHTLGQFTYDYNPAIDEYVVRDKYDFNPYPGGKDIGASEKNLTDPREVERDAVNDWIRNMLSGNLYGAARSYGQLALPSYGDQGVPVQINLESPTQKSRRRERAGKAESSKRAGKSEYMPYGEQTVGY